MIIKKQLHILFCLLVCASMNLQAQSDGLFPFSRAGLGQLHNPNMPSLSLMGGLTAAYHDAYRPSLSNPASLGFLEVTAFDVGGHAQFNNILEGELIDNSWNGLFDHLALSFPILNPLNEIIENEKYPVRWGAQIAIRNNSSVNYDIITAEFDPGTATTRREFIGDGGTYTLNLNQGWKYKHTSVGLGLGLISGEIEFDRLVTLQDESAARRTNLSRDFTIRGFVYNLGIQQDIFLSKPKEGESKFRKPRLQIGATYHTNTSFTTRSQDLILSERRTGPNTWVTADTIANSLGEPVSLSGTLPAEINLGIIYNSGNKLQVGANYYHGAWSAYKNQAKDDELNDSWRASVGGKYQPDPQSFRSLFKRSSYKWGAFIGDDPRTFDGIDNQRQQISHMGVTAGIEMPFAFQRQFAFVNLGVELGRYELEEILTRNYFRISLGITMTSNQWFLKRKYN